MAGTHRHIRRAANFIEWPVAATTDFEVGDLMFYAAATQAHATVGSVYPLADFVWDSSEEVTRRNAAPYFVGVSAEARTGNEANASTMIVPSGCIFEMPMTSGTPVVGTLLGFEKASGNTLLSAKLQIVTDIADAIGYCIKRYTAATTTVECILFSPYDVAGGLSSRVHILPVYIEATLWAAGGNFILNYTFKKRVKLLSLTSVEVDALTANSVLTLVNGTDSLDDTHTVTATAVGTVLRTTIEDANGYDLFVHDDPMDLTSDGTSSAGSAQLYIEYMDMPFVA